MRTKISSGDVILTKLGLPIIIAVAVFTFVCVSSFSATGKRLDLKALIAMVFVMALVYVITLVSSLPLHDVWVDDALYVRNVIRLERIPFSHIKSVTEDPMAIPKRVTIEVDPPCKVGSRIVFSPRFRPFRDGADHPDILYLRSLVDSAPKKW